MGHSSLTIAFRLVMAGALGVVGMSSAFAQQGGGSQQAQSAQPNWQRGPVYQRKGSDRNKGFGHGDFRRKDRRLFRQKVPNVQSGWFTRPYPYHLDFYKMKYGGSYAPYFGNLYGPPAVVTAPPYYGPYYGGWGPEDGRYAPDGINDYGSAPDGQPGLSPEGTIVEGPVDTVVPNRGHQVDQPVNESLPPPRQ